MDDFDVRGAVAVGERRAVVFDTLSHPEQMQSVPRLTRGRALTVVYSHADWDHCWGTCALGGVTEVVAHRAAAERFGRDVPTELARRRREDGDHWDAVRLVPPTRSFSRRTSLDLGGVTLELGALRGHTPDCIVGRVPEWEVLLAGDAVETPLPVVNDGAAVPAWADALERLLAKGGFGLVVPSHGPIGGAEIIERNVTYLRGLLAGRGGPPRTALSPFYRRTHERNIRLVEAALG